MYKFAKLLVWQKSVELVKVCYQLTKVLHSREKYGLFSQINRASVSIAANIAEGCGSGSDREFRRYLLIARKSLYETVTLLKICDQIYSIQDISEILDSCNEVGKLLGGLLKKLKSNS